MNKVTSTSQLSGSARLNMSTKAADRSPQPLSASRVSRVSTSAAGQLAREKSAPKDQRPHSQLQH